jgi:hypothetical protein
MQNDLLTRLLRACIHFVQKAEGAERLPRDVEAGGVRS